MKPQSETGSASIITSPKKNAPKNAPLRRHVSTPFLIVIR